MAEDPALNAEDYKALHAMLLSEDAPTKAQGLDLAKKLTPTEQQAFFDYQQQANKGKGELTRIDDQSPELLGLIGAGAGLVRAVAAPGLSLAARGAAGVKAAASSAAPVVKYEVVKRGLGAIGVPEPLAMIGGYAASGYRRVGAPAAVAAESVAAKPSVAAVLSDVDLARQEFAAGRLPKAALDAVERAAARKAPAAPVAAPAAPEAAAAPPSAPVSAPAPAPASPIPAAPVVEAAPTSPAATTLYHSSPRALKGGKPNFDAFFGNDEFVKTFSPTEFGKNLYKVELPATSKVLDLNSGSVEAREFMAKAAQVQFPEDAAFAKELRAGDPKAIDDFYEVWTDKNNTMKALQQIPGYDAVKFQNEYVLPKETIAKLTGQKIANPTALSAPSAATSPTSVSPAAAPRLKPAQIASDIWVSARKAGVTLSPEQNSAAFKAVQGGMTPEAAVASVKTVTPAMIPAEAFNARFGLKTPTEAETKFPKGQRGKPAGSD